jgi:hypothetical protein
MDRLLFLGLTLSLAMIGIACRGSSWSIKSGERWAQPIEQTDDLRQVWIRHWIADEPSHITRDRVPGIGP